MGSFRKISDIISVDDSGSNEIICVNGQWQFTLPDGLSYGVNEEFSLIEGGIDLSGSVKPLVIKEDWSVYDQAFCASVAEHYSFTGDHITIIDCKYDNRFSENNGMNSQKVIVDEDDFYVDLTSVNTWPFGVQAEIRVRGEGITPYNISMMVKPEGDDHWQHIADYFKEIVFSICKSKKTAKTKTTSKKAAQSVSDPNCIMSGTVLQRYIGNEEDVVLPEGITELADNIFSGRGDLRSIVIPEGVTRIGNRAFENCFNLQEVVLPESIVEIGGYAFVDCHNLESINLDGELESIESSVFSECFKLNNVNIPESVKYIDAFAFKNCRAFTKIVIPEGVTSIGFTAFAACSNLEYLYIPTSVTGIYDNFMGQTPFDGCSSLTIYCPQGAYAKEYADAHGFKCEFCQPISTGTVKPRKSTRKTVSNDLHARPTVQNRSIATEAPAITCTKVKKADCEIDEFGVFERYNGLDDEIILPSGIEEIGSDAFSFNKTLRIVVIPEGVREIGNDAFWGCEALEQVFLPSTLEKIEYNAFRNCESLTEIIIPDGVWSIGMDAFTGCKKLKDIYVPSSVISVEMDAFYTFNDDTVIHTPQWSSAETYAEEHDMRVDHRQAPVRAVPKAKKNTSQTKAATAKAAATTGNPADFEIVDGVLKSYKGQEEHLIIPDGIHTIAEKAFDSIYNLKTIVVPEGVHTIEDDALHYCWQLESVTLPSTLITLSGFAYLSIKKLLIPVGVETIGINAFKGCGELRKVILPSSVTQIEKGAFAWCSKKKDVYIPESVTSIADDAFSQSPRIVIHVHPGSYAEEFAKGHKVKFDNDVDPYLDELKKAEKGSAKKKTTSKQEEMEAEATVETTHIAQEPEYNQVKKRVKLEDDGWSIAVPDDFEYSNDESKNGESRCNPRGRYELIIAQPKSKYFVNFDDPYSNRTSFVTLERVDHLTALNWYRSFDSWVIVKNEPGLTIQYMPMMSNMHVVNYIVVIETDKSARRCQFVMAGKQKKEEKLRFVEDMLSTVRLIGDENEVATAQSGGDKKKTTSKVAKTEAKAIVETTPAEPAAPFSLSASGKTLNKYEGKETVVVVPDGVTEISSFAFSDTKVASVTLPDSVKKIGQYAFNGCTKLEQIRIPESVTSVGGYAFAKCSALKEITWPGSIKKIPNAACDNCSALETVVIEEGVTEIDQSAFSFCEKLKDIFLPLSLSKIGDFFVLGMLFTKPTLHVYSGSYAESYAQKEGFPTVVLLTPEQEAEKKRQEEARRIAEEKYAAELKAWEQACGEIRTLREQRVSELLEEKRTALQNEAQSKYNAAVTAANKRKEAAQQKKADAEMRLGTLGIFKFAEKKATKVAIEEATGEIQAAEAALVTAKQSLDKDLTAIPATINSRRYMVSREVEQEYPLPAKPEKPL